MSPSDRQRGLYPPPGSSNKRSARTREVRGKTDRDVELGPPPPDPFLRATLDAFLSTVDRDGVRRMDPVELVHRYADPADQEVAGLVVAFLAYGRAVSIRDRAGAVLEALGPHPARALTRRAVRRRLDGFVYRFQRGDDLPRFLEGVARLQGEYGSLRAAFAAGDEPGGTYVLAMRRFVDRLRGSIPGPLSYGLRFLLPVTGPGAAKRLCLYLRWMIRSSDGIDLGAWSDALEASRLVIPLDTHLARLGRYLGFTTRATPDLKMALEITGSLRRLAPRDPLRFDIALCHLGISGRCPRRRDLEKCRACPIQAICALGPEPAGWSGLRALPVALASG